MTLTDHQQRVMEVLIQHPEGLTAWEISQLLNGKLTASAVMVRINSLRKWGMIEKVGERKHPRGGGMSKVWKVVQ